LIDVGYRVEAATMKLAGLRDDDIISSAAACARTLGVPFRTLDLGLPFQDLVIRDFTAEYRAGRTPNPCVRCNQLFKFGYFLQQALALGFDFIATGHYVRRVEEQGEYRLKRGLDRNEQSYFLYRLNQFQLSRSLFPLGSSTKESVRRSARRRGLPTAHRRKSQDVCFLPDADYTAYLRKLLPERPGDIVDQKGRVIGRHRGVAFFTIGQRRGIGISSGRPYYVTAIDAPGNRIQVGDRTQGFRTTLLAGQINFIHGNGVRGRRDITAKARYNAPLSPVRLAPVRGGIRVRFEKPQWALAPGQSVVFYRSDDLLGGGIIETVIA
jgi:tRNA-specific 2-thiouridylase